MPALEHLRNPAIDRGPLEAARDPALIYESGIWRCFHTCAVRHGDRYDAFLDVATSQDMVTWSTPERLTTSSLNFSSPGNIIHANDQWVLCVQSYPIEPGQVWGSEASRLWLMRSDDLVHWSEPEPLHPPGCQARWTNSHRQIDPYLVYHDNRYWCFYKTSGQLGLLVSDDLQNWQEASPDRPVLGAHQTPDGVTVENPCVIRTGDTFVLFFAPCRKGRGIGVAYSNNLLDWRDAHYLSFPDLPWADGGPTAAMVIDARPEFGHWLMAFHGDRHDDDHRHSAAIGLAWSDDLEHWHVPWPKTNLIQGLRP